METVKHGRLSNNHDEMEIRHPAEKEEEQEGVTGFLDSIADTEPLQHTRRQILSPVPIAVCGLAMRLPGGVHDANDFWDLLFNGKDARTSVPNDRYHARSFNDELGPSGAIKSEMGYFIDDDLSALDTSFFSLSRDELEKTDPQQRQFLEVTRECLENAGEVNYRGKSIGCYVGTFGEDWLYMSAKESQHTGGYVYTGYSDLMIANRVSYEFDFTGPSMVIKTGCSASLTGLHEACRALQSGDCTAAVVGGTSLIMGPTATAHLTADGILSAEASCKTFDATADGFARAEAITAVYLKTLDDAIRDGNPVRAVIRNTVSNSDGKSSSIMAPNGRSHELMMRKAYADCGLKPQDTPYVECHGTGTATGDPVEAKAVGNVFEGQGIFIGSVKPNIGHSEGASGLSSLIKAILSLEHGIIPPNIKFNNPNPKIPFREKRMTVPITPVSWPEGRSKRISVNSFGIGGANVHVIVDAYNPRIPATNSRIMECNSAPTLLLYSANKTDSLQSLVDNYRIYLKENPKRLLDLAYTLAMRREHLPYRAYGIVGNDSVLTISSLSKVPAKLSSLVMVFSGQGAQWSRMGTSLMHSDAEFLRDIRDMDKVLQSLMHPPEWSIEEELHKGQEISLLHKAEIAQCLCTAIQIALTNAFARAAIRPIAVVGHSSGEIGAAYASGALCLRAAMVVAYYRGFVTKCQVSTGGMAAIGMGREDTQALLGDGVVIACENSPVSVTISGDVKDVQQSVETIKFAKPGVFTRLLNVDQAYHSHYMEKLSHKYISLVRDELLRFRTLPKSPRALFFSSVTCTTMERAEQFKPEYWQSNLCSPVLFSQAATEVTRHFNDCLFLEIGPHSTLAGPLRQICLKAEVPFSYIPSMLKKQQCAATILSAFGQLFQAGYQVRFDKLIPPGKVLTDLPRYPWDHNASYWYEARVSKDWRFRKFGRHALLGVRVPESTDLEPAWRHVLYLENLPWLREHRVTSDIVMPFAAYCTIAGEAVRQISGIEGGYKLRHVIVHTAMVLVDSKPIEIVTNLRRHKLTDSLTSEYWEFSILSYSGAAWIRNCDGLVMARRCDLPVAPSQIRPVLRPVESQKFYEAVASTGVQFGPSFQRLGSILCSTTELLATGVIDNTGMQQNLEFLFHPTALDACLQLAVIAMNRGIDRGNLVIPTTIEELEVARSASTMNAVARISEDVDGTTVFCTDQDRTVLRLSGMRLTPLNNGTSATDPEPHAAARLEWRPLLDFQDHRTLFEPPNSLDHMVRLQEEVTLLCILDTAERLKGLVPIQPYFHKYRQWLRKQICRAESGAYPVINNVEKLLEFSLSKRKEYIEMGFEQLSTHPRSAIIAIATRRIWENAEFIFTGELDVLSLLTEDKVLTDIYTATSFGYSGFIQLLSHANPTLKILEVGGGTGGTTQTFLRDLIDAEGFSQYSLYTFTDISAGFFLQAKERFSYAPNMHFKTFDISRDPLEQGFERESYDLILAPSVVHATPVLHNTLCNLRILLRKGGYLLMTELIAEVRTPSFIFGNLDGWWLGEADGRTDEPSASIDRWNRELKDAGFTGADTVVFDAEEPYQLFAAIVSQPIAAQLNKTEDNSITVLSNAPTKEPGRSLISALKKDNYKVSVCALGTDIIPKQDTISLLDLESDFLHQISEDALAAFQRFLVKHASQKLLYLTRPSQVACRDPCTAMSIGFARAIRSDLATPCSTLEIDPLEPSLVQTVIKLFRKIQETEDNESLSPDFEYVYDRGVLKVGRYHPYSLERAARCRVHLPLKTFKRLEITNPGDLESFRWVELPTQSTIGDDQIEIEIMAVGLSFRDVMLAAGTISSEVGCIPLGMEASGVISRVGSSVSLLKVGDRVMFLTSDGCVATKVVVPASLAVKLPEKLSIEAAATMPLCFTTALQALIVIGRLEKGQSVLIHSAAGGVGHAAIQVCMAVGAKIFVTVGSESKAEYLVQSLGIPRDHIFDSRSDSFERDLKAATDRKGVDIVLNSLSGDLLHASWRCVAKFGTLVELGRKDLIGHGKLDLEGFAACQSYCCVDLPQLIRERPDNVAQLLQRLLDGYLCGYYCPIRCNSLVDASEVTSTFQDLQNGQLIGKVILKMSQTSSNMPAVKQAESLSLDPGASYLLTGGLGGLGKIVARWMVERGARSLIFLSRRAGASDADKAFITELESMGCSAIPEKGTVQAIEDVRRAVARAVGPIKGVVHFAAVIRDGRVTEINYADWNAGVTPKVAGAWNLHNALENHDLDFFILASSVNSFNHQTGQCNYIAANTFLEAFCQFRRARGLAASVINITPMEGFGFVADNPAVRKALKSSGVYFLREHHLLDFLELAMLHSRPSAASSLSKISLLDAWYSEGQYIMGLRAETPLDDVSSRIAWRHDRRMALYHNVRETTDTQTTASDSDELRFFLGRAADEPHLLADIAGVRVLAEAIGKKVFGFLMRPEEEMSLDLTLAQVGLDSLTAVELRRWWRLVFGVEISVLEILAAGTLEQLGQVAAAALGAKAATAVGTVPDQ